MDASFYNSPEWRALRERAFARDGSRCLVARLFGGDCSHVLHAHHIVPIEDGGAPLDIDNVGTTCASHHPMWEAMRRYVVAKQKPKWKRCTRHNHPYKIGRDECERRMNGLPPDRFHMETASDRLTAA